MRQRKKYSSKKHLFDTDPEYLLKYVDMIKQEKYWRNNGQYFMAKECERRASCLEKENIGGYESYRKTEELYCDTKKSAIYTYQGIVNLPEPPKTSRQYNNKSYNARRYNSNQSRNSGSESSNWRNN